eukprot:33958_1
MPNKSEARKRYLRSVKANKYTNKSMNGIRAVLLTCDQGREKQCREEVMDLFNEIADSQFPIQAEDSTETPVSSSEFSLADSLKEELEEMQKPESERFAWFKMPRGLALIQIKDKSLDPVRFVSEVFEEVLRRRVQLTRFTVRMTPFSATCFPSVDEILKTAKPIITEAFESVPKTSSFSISVKRRANKKINRDALITGIAAMVGPDFKADLKNPDVVIFVESFGTSVGISVISKPGDFKKFHGFNMRKMAESITNDDLGEVASTPNSESKPCTSSESKNEPESSLAEFPPVKRPRVDEAPCPGEDQLA